MKNKFFTTNGWLTFYAMACGYRHESQTENGYHVIFEINNAELNTFDIKVYGPTSLRYEWEVIVGVVAARKMYGQMVKKYCGTTPAKRFEKAIDINRKVYA